MPSEYTRTLRQLQDRRDAYRVLHETLRQNYDFNEAEKVLGTIAVITDRIGEHKASELNSILKNLKARS